MATPWGRLPKATRDAYAATAKETYGLSRSQLAGRYNRGTYDPGSRTSLSKPREYRYRHQGGAVPVPAHTGKTPSDIPWATLARQNIDRHLGEAGLKYNTDRIIERLDSASPFQLRMIAGASEDDIREWARYQTPDETPEEIRDLIWVQIDGKWVNISWYK